MDAKAYSQVPARLHAMPSWLITQIATHAARLVTQGLSNVGAHRYHFALMAALEEFGPLSQAELGRRSGIDRSYIVESLNELEDAGMVVRAVDPADRRRNTVTVTKAGLDQLRRIDGALAEAQDAMLDGLSVTERATLTALLTRVLHQVAGRDGG
ncbi:MarR family winged helix-turn-helix transcriptional regulator [Streptomyces sp. NPDC007369]|uniref:MarR family winged helix-turn-helix transcriptional regulator n=1 Tax=Streptomyces sp. NPDC007369 TaxID=3154589 RepID=UPI00340532B8